MVSSVLCSYVAVLETKSELFTLSSYSCSIKSISMTSKKTSRKHSEWGGLQTDQFVQGINGGTGERGFGKLAHLDPQ